MSLQEKSNIKTTGYKDTYADYRSKLSDMTTAWAKTYQGITSDFAFASGGTSMWEKNVLSIRQNQSRPVISLPLLQPYIDRIVSPVRMHPPGMAVRTEDPVIEDLVNGIIRGIERASSATDSYAKALKGAATGGLSWLYLSVEDENNETVIRIKSTSDPTVILIDPMSTTLDGRDAQYACYRGFMGKEQAVRLYGDKAGNKGFTSAFENMTYNIPSDAVMDCIWYLIENNGMRITRTVGEAEVFNQFYEGVRSIPVVPVIGEELFGADGRKFGGLVRRSRDINTSINITASNIMELVALAPKSPWIGAAEGFEQYKDTWATSNTEPHAYIPFKHIDKDGNPIPMPVRVDNGAQTQGLQSVAEWMQSLLGKTIGMSDAMLGGLETAQESGKSLIARMEAAEGATAQYIDHLMTSIAQLARVLIQMIPIVYSGDRSIVIIDDSGRSNRVRGDIANVLTSDVVNMLDVEVDSGPQMEMRRKSAGDALQTLITGLGPEKGSALLDMWADTQPLPNIGKIKDRLKKMMPQELLDPEDSNNPQDPEALHALQQADDVIAQKDQTIQYMEGVITQLQNSVNSQEQLAQMELRKAEINAQIQLQKTQMEIAGRKEIELIKQGSEDKRLATKLTLEQQEQINKLTLEMIKQNESTISNIDNDNLDVGVEAAPRLPEYILNKMNSELN